MSETAMPNGGTMLPRGRGRPNLSEEDKIAIVRAYAEWKTKGGESPIQELMKKYNISRNTPAKLWNKLLTRGTVLSQHKGSRKRARERMIQQQEAKESEAGLPLPDGVASISDIVEGHSAQRLRQDKGLGGASLAAAEVLHGGAAGPSSLGVDIGVAHASDLADSV